MFFMFFPNPRTIKPKKMSNPETSISELHSSYSSPNQDNPNWLTHSKSISAQKIPTQSILKPLGNQTHKSRKIYKFTLKKKTNKQTNKPRTVWAKSDANKPKTVSHRPMPTTAADSPSRGSMPTNLSSAELPS